MFDTLGMKRNLFMFLENWFCYIHFTTRTAVTSAAMHFSAPWRRSVSHRSPPQSKLDGVHVGDGAPHLGDQTLLGDVDVAQVEGVVDGLHLPHLDEPHSDRLRGGLQDPLPVILGLVQHLLGVGVGVGGHESRGG